MIQFNDPSYRSQLRGAEESWVLVADPHVKKTPGMWSNRSEIRGDDMFALSQAVQLCLDTRSHLMLLGDTFDCAANPANPVYAVSQALRPMLDSGLRVVHYDGNHEFSHGSAYGHVPWLSLVQGAEYVHARQFQWLGMQAYALDYFQECNAEAQFSLVPQGTQVLFLHGTADIIMPAAYDFRAVDIPMSVRLCICGHYHTPVTTDQTPTGATLVYPGSPWATAHTHRHEKRVLTAFRDQAGMLVLQPVQIAERGVYEASVGSLQTNEDVQSLIETIQGIDATHLPEEIRKPIVLIGKSASREIIQALAGFVHVYTVNDGVTVDGVVQAPVDLDAPEDSDESILAEYVDPAEQALQFEFIMDILRSGVEPAMDKLRAALSVGEGDSAAASVQKLQVQ